MQLAATPPLKELGDCPAPYRHLIECIRQVRPDLKIGLCLEDEAMFTSLGLQESIGQCNCVL
jgi:hypothetical protein